MSHLPADASDADRAIALLAVAQAAQSLRRAVCVRLQTQGLTWTEAAVLALLRQHSPQSRSALARLLHAGRRATAELLDQMERAGRLTRLRRTTNRRAVAFVLTGTGQEAAEQVDAIIEAVATQAFAALDDADLSLLRNVLGAVRDLTALTAGSETSWWARSPKHVAE